MIPHHFPGGMPTMAVERKAVLPVTVFTDYI
jgi:hypothetical protein